MLCAFDADHTEYVGAFTGGLISNPHRPASVSLLQQSVVREQSAEGYDWRVVSDSVPDRMTTTEEGGSAWVMQMQACSGARLPGLQGQFDVNGDGVIDSLDGVVIDDRWMRFSMAATFHTPNEEKANWLRFEPGYLAGYIRNADNEIESLWYIKPCGRQLRDDKSSNLIKKQCRI